MTPCREWERKKEKFFSNLCEHKIKKVVVREQKKRKTALLPPHWMMLWWMDAYECRLYYKLNLLCHLILSSHLSAVNVREKKEKWMVEALSDRDNTSSLIFFHDVKP